MSSATKKALFTISMFFLIIFSLFFIYGEEGSKDLVASLAQLPGLADSPDKGTYVDLVKAIDEVYTEGTIKIELYPMIRSINNIIERKADFHLPNLKSSLVKESDLPYHIVTEKMGVVSIVIYSNMDKPITKKMIDEAVAKKGEFPYKIESAGGMEMHFPFPISSTPGLDQSLQKVSSKRLDAFLWAQEEGDMVLKDLKLKNILRSHYQDIDDVAITVKGPRGEEIDKILSTAIKKLRASGRFEKLYSKIHHPYEEWQPSK